MMPQFDLLTKTRKRKAKAAIIPTSKDSSSTTNNNPGLEFRRKVIRKNTLELTTTRIHIASAEKAKN